MPGPIDCLGLGIAPADLIMQIAAFPKPGAKIDSTGMIVQGGGPIPTAMVALSRLGYNPSLIGAVGNDVFGEFILKELRTEGVDTSQIIIKNNPSAIASGWAEEKNGRRTIVLDLNIEVKPSDIILDRLPCPRVIHLDGRYLEACMKIARWGRKLDIPVVFDIGSLRNDVSALIPLSDHLVCAEEFALPYTGCRITERAMLKLAAQGPSTVVITRGTKGSVGYSKETGMIYQKAFCVKAIDTTGAGDAYHGGYLAGLLENWDLPKRMEFASAVGALNCTGLGGRAGLPTKKEAFVFLERNGGKYV